MVPSIQNFQIFISYIAAPIPMCIALFVVAIILFIIHDGKEFLKIFTATVFAEGLMYGLKNLFKVPRPFNMVITEDGYRFPSGHATMAAVVMVLGIHYAHLHIKNKLLRYFCYIIAFLWYVLVSYSRLDLHEHYLVDVITGGAIGIFCTILTLSIFTHFGLIKKGTPLFKK